MKGDEEMEKLFSILSAYQNEEWFYDVRIEEAVYNDLIASYNEYSVELIVKNGFTVEDLEKIVVELKENGFNLESFFDYKKRSIKDTYSISFGVWRR